MTGCKKNSRSPLDVGFAQTLVALALLGSACAPLATFRPANSFLEGRSMEIGLGAVTLSPRPYVDEQWHQVAQLWVAGRAAPWLYLSGIAAFDSQAAAAGGAAKFLLARADRFALGVEPELGYAWGSLATPFAFRLFEQTWVYSSPHVGTYGVAPIFGVPLGVSAHLHRNLFVRVEYQTSWVNLLAYEHRTHLGAGLAVQW